MGGGEAEHPLLACWRVNLVRITDLPAVGRVLATVTAARQVRESVRFAARELGRSRATRRYTLRGSDVAINIRHNSPDVAVLIEIFADGFYEPPAPVAQLLAKPAPRALDLGANIGLFGAFLTARLPSARIVGFEPDRATACSCGIGRLHSSTCTITGSYSANSASS